MAAVGLHVDRCCVLLPMMLLVQRVSLSSAMDAVIINADFSEIRAGGQPGQLEDGSWVHFGNVGNSDLVAPIAVPGWQAVGGSEWNAGIAKRSAAEGGGQVLFINDALYVHQDLQGLVISAGMVLLLTVAVSRGNDEAASYSFGLYANGGRALKTAEGDIAGELNLIDGTRTVSVTVRAEDYADAHGIPLQVRLAKSRSSGQVQYHWVSLTTENEACGCTSPWWQRWLGDLRLGRAGGGWRPGALEQACREGNQRLMEAVMEDGVLVHEDSICKRPPNKLECLPGLVGVASACAAYYGQHGLTDQMQQSMRFALRLLICATSFECLDSPDFAVPAVEVLDNYRTMTISYITCAFDETSQCRQDWEWSPVAVGGLPFRDLDMLTVESKWVSAGGGVFAVIRWLDLGIQNEAAFWYWWFKKVRNGAWLTQDDAGDWTHDDLCNITKDSLTPRILNVGSGPVVPNSLVCGERAIPVISTDGLAHLFWRLYDTLELTPPMLPMQCTFEQLTRCFPRGYFPLVHVRNSLDHAVDLHAALLELLAVTRRGGTVLLRHGRNEGAHMEYSGMHVWSFDVDTSFTPHHAVAIFGRERSWQIDLNLELAGVASISASVVSLQESGRTEGVITRNEYVFVDMTKL